jgi:hypothetical protein
VMTTFLAILNVEVIPLCVPTDPPEVATTLDITWEIPPSKVDILQVGALDFMFRALSTEPFF